MEGFVEAGGVARLCCLGFKGCEIVEGGGRFEGIEAVWYLGMN